MGLRGGRLDWPVELQSPTLGTSADPTDATWTRERILWTERVPLESAERFFSAAVLAAAAVVYRARTPRVPSGWRIVDGDEVFAISSVQDFRRRGYQLIAASRRDTRG